MLGEQGKQAVVFAGAHGGRTSERWVWARRTAARVFDGRVEVRAWGAVASARHGVTIVARVHGVVQMQGRVDGRC